MPCQRHDIQCNIEHSPGDRCDQLEAACTCPTKNGQLHTFLDDRRVLEKWWIKSVESLFDSTDVDHRHFLNSDGRALFRHTIGALIDHAEAQKEKEALEMVLIELSNLESHGWTTTSLVVKIKDRLKYLV